MMVYGFLNRELHGWSRISQMPGPARLAPVHLALTRAYRALVSVLWASLARAPFAQRKGVWPACFVFLWVPAPVSGYGAGPGGMTDDCAGMTWGVVGGGHPPAVSPSP